MVAAARKNHRAVQVGAQGRNGLEHGTRVGDPHGMIGKVSKVTCWHYANPVDENPVPTATRRRSWIGTCGLGATLAALQPAICGRVFAVPGIGGGQIRDRGHQFSTISGA